MMTSVADITLSSGYGPTLNDSFSALVTSAWAKTTSQKFSCNAWTEPSRAVLQVLVILMIIANIGASLIIFSVSTNVRGKHVAFLFGCVRILNILDIAQCVVILFSPIFIPPSCRPNHTLCNFLGYLFATTTLFSPLVAIVMAVDRCVAVYFHVWYKQHPYLKMKYFILGLLLVIYGFYFTLPMYTEFGEYVAVPWLAVCSFEWGAKHRAFNIVLELANLILFITLLISNAGIVIRIKQRQNQMKKMKNLHEKSKRSSVRKSVMKRFHRSADDILGVSDGGKTPPETPTPSPSTFRARMSKSRPPPLKIPKYDVIDNLGKPHLRLTPTLTVTPPLTPITRAKTSSASYRRPRSQTPTSNLLTPSPLSDVNPPSPLVGKSHDWPSPKQRTRTITVTSRPRSLMRSTSADNILSGFSPAVIPSSKPQTPTLLRQVLDYPQGKICDPESARLSTTTKSSDESDATRRRFLHSSTSSFFPFPFNASRGSTLRKSEKRKKHRMVRKSASRITKMTSAICLVFVILYLPFLIRKLIQLFPEEYGGIPIPVWVELMTLFGPFLSPLVNPIVYVFLNPHYKEKSKQKFSVLQAKISCSARSRRLISTSTAQLSFYTPAVSLQRKKKRPKKDHAHQKSDQPQSSQNDDVFEMTDQKGKSP